MKKKIQETEEKEKEVIRQRDAKVVAIGNLVHDSVPVSQDEVRPCSREGDRCRGGSVSIPAAVHLSTYATGRGRGSVGLVLRNWHCLHLHSDYTPMVT